MREPVPSGVKHTFFMYQVLILILCRYWSFALVSLSGSCLAVSSSCKMPCIVNGKLGIHR